MARKGRVSASMGREAVAAWKAAYESGGVGDDFDVRLLATAVRYTLDVLAQIAPGTSVEVRVPPFGAVQCLPGPGHSRGTPANVVELSAETWLLLATGLSGWGDVAGRVSVSGVRALEVVRFLPL